MSSHHVIRENQEPAVAFVSEVNCDSNILNALLEWSPHVVAVYESVNYLIDYGVKVDAVLGNNKELTSLNSLFEKQSHIKFQKIDEQSPILATTSYLIKNNHKAVYIVAPFDKAYSEIAAQSQLTICIIDGKKKWSFISSGKVRKWFPEKAILKFSGNTTVTILDKTHKPIGFKPELKMPISGLYTFESEEYFWLGETLNDNLL